MAAWNDWYHVNGNTYGTWLPGDPRGWRERGHKEHVSGDYKSPPPAGSGDLLHRYSQNLLKQPPMRLSHEQRTLAGRAMVELLMDQEIEVIAFALDSIHLHLLGRFPSVQVRPVVGRAKKHAYFVLRDRGFVGRLWGEGTNVVPIKDCQHQLNVFGYIARHKDKGAWVWTFKEGLYWWEA
jgi:hypothetical protein